MGPADGAMELQAEHQEQQVLHEDQPGAGQACQAREVVSLTFGSVKILLFLIFIADSESAAQILYGPILVKIFTIH